MIQKQIVTYAKIKDERRMTVSVHCHLESLGEDTLMDTLDCGLALPVPLALQF